MKQLNLRQIIFLALCVTLSLISKRLVSPFTNILTDFIRIPGGGAATAFSLVFLIIGCSVTEYRFAATLCAIAQGFLAVCMGMSSYQGAFVVITYVVPGIVIDILRTCIRTKDVSYFMLTCCISNTVCAVVSNLLVFHLTSIALLLWILVAASFGLIAGSIGSVVYTRLRPIYTSGGLLYE